MQTFQPRTFNLLSGWLGELGFDSAFVDEMIPFQEFHRFSVDEQRERTEATLERVVTDLGLRRLPVLLGLRSSTADRPILGLAVRVAPDLGDALERVVSYRALWDRAVLVRLVRSPRQGRTRLEVESKDGGGVGSQVLREWALVSFIQFARALARAPIRPRRVYLSHPEPPESALFERFFAAPVVYRSGCDAVEFDDETLATTLPDADSTMSQVVLSQLENLKELRTRESDGLPERARRVIQERLIEGEIPSAQAAARRLGTSTRTLRRQLRSRRVSYTELVASTRLDRACELLALTELSVTDVAFEVGFATPGAFARAFKRWKGEAPAAFRRRLRLRGNA